MRYSQLMILISLLCMMEGLFTPLPAGVFGTAGVIGTVLGWIFETRRVKKIQQQEDDYIDVDFTVSGDKTQKRPMDFDERLRKLEDLLNDGLITDEEYEKKRKEIMKTRW